MERLPEEIVEEILLRLPLDDPASLLRAATVRRSWCRIISAPRFRRRFGQRHRTVPILGFLANHFDRSRANVYFVYNARFFPATPFRPRRSEHRGRRVLDSCHGRVLLTPGADLDFSELEVWDPVTDELWEIPKLVPPSPSIGNSNAAVVCADYGECDHLVCGRGPFLVVFLDDDDERLRVHLYSSEAGAWSEPSYGPPSPEENIDIIPAALVGDAVYFLIDLTSSVLKYNLATRNVSVIHLPPDFLSDYKVLMAMGDGGLGFAMVRGSTILVCSMQTDPNGDDCWQPVRSVELGVHADSVCDDRIAFVPGVEVLIVRAAGAWLSIDLKTGLVNQDDDQTIDIIPYMNFYTPDLHQYGVVPV